MTVGSYFKPLRRKIGIVTLLLACVFLAGWVRSQFAWDGINFYSESHRTDALISRNSTIGWGAGRHDAPVPSEKLHTATWSSASVSFDRTKKVDLALPGPKVLWEVYGVQLAETSFPGTRWTVLEVSYWILLTPLTLASAWLLLSKPRTSKTKAASES